MYWVFSSFFRMSCLPMWLSQRTGMGQVAQITQKWLCRVQRWNPLNVNELCFFSMSELFQLVYFWQLHMGFFRHGGYNNQPVVYQYNIPFGKMLFNQLLLSCCCNTDLDCRSYCWVWLVKCLPHSLISFPSGLMRLMTACLFCVWFLSICYLYVFALYRFRSIAKSATEHQLQENMNALRENVIWKNKLKLQRWFERVWLANSNVKTVMKWNKKYMFIVLILQSC
jgi:hypothetical protein